MAIPTPVDGPAAKPSDKPEWATVDNPNGPGGANNVIAPGASKIQDGWDVGERPAREYMNWFQRFTDQWVDYLEEIADRLAVVEGAMQENWSINAGSTTGLALAINPGYITQGQIPTATEGTSTITVLNLADDTTNYIYYDEGTNALVDSTTAPTSEDTDFILLYRIVTASGVIDWANANTTDYRTINKQRPIFAGQSTVGEVPAPSTEDRNFLMDDGTFDEPYPKTGAAVNSDRTLQLSDNWSILYHSGAATQDWTVPPNSSVAFPIGATIFLVNGPGAGAITILEGAGVDVFANGDAGAGSQVMPGLGNVATLRKVGTDVWALEQNTGGASTTVYALTVDAPLVAGTASILGSNANAAGWSISDGNQDGEAIITHNLGLADADDLHITVTPDDGADAGANSVIAYVTDKGTNSFQVNFEASDTDTLAAGVLMIIAVR